MNNQLLIIKYKNSSVFELKNTIHLSHEKMVGFKFVISRIGTWRLY